MTNREIMRSALKNTVIKDLRSQGFVGKYPHLKRVMSDCIELIDFKTNRYGGSFTVEVSAVFPDSKITNLSDFNAIVDENKVDVSYTNERYQLDGMFDGWFYYTDVYIMPNGFYYDVPEKEWEDFVPEDDWYLLQAFDEKTADDICEEISLQLDDAFEWLLGLKRTNCKKNERKKGLVFQEEKVIKKRIFGFLVGFFALLIFALFWFGVDCVGR